MLYKYKTLSISKKHEGKIISLDKKKSIINGINVMPDGISKYYSIIDPNLIETIPETPEEEKDIVNQIVLETSTENRIINSFEDPTPTTNSKTYDTAQEIMWINNTTGEIFICIDYTIDNNVWVGQITGKKISNKIITLESIKSYNLIAHFNFHHIKGDKFLSSNNEISAYFNDLSQSSNTPFNEGKSCYFSKKSELEIKNGEYFMLDIFSIAYWVKPKHLKESTHIHKDEMGEFSIWQDRNGRINCQCGDEIGNTMGTTSIGSIQENEWNHITIIKNNDYFEIYINAIKQNVTNYGPVITVSKKTDTDIDIGYGYKDEYNGHFDELYFFDRVLLPEEITILKNNG